jgi:hypothetical protein
MNTAKHIETTRRAVTAIHLPALEPVEFHSIELSISEETPVLKAPLEYSTASYTAIELIFDSIEPVEALEMKTEPEPVLAQKFLPTAMFEVVKSPDTLPMFEVKKELLDF